MQPATRSIVPAVVTESSASTTASDAGYFFFGEPSNVVTAKVSSTSRSARRGWLVGPASSDTMGRVGGIASGPFTG
jgi:hypothetical protein